MRSYSLNVPDILFSARNINKKQYLAMKKLKSWLGQSMD